MNQQPKTSYQDFLKDIYSAMKKINQTTGDIFAKLESLDVRIANLEKSYVLLSEDVKKLIPNTSYNYSNHSNTLADTGISPTKQTGASKLLSLLTQLNDSENDISDTGMDVYTLGTNTELESVITNLNPKQSPSFNAVCTGLHSPDTENNYGSVTADISPTRLPFGSSITQNNMQADMQDDFMILE
jgi:hypothetical protein